MWFRIQYTNNPLRPWPLDYGWIGEAEFVDKTLAMPTLHRPVGYFIQNFHMALMPERLD